MNEDEANGGLFVSMGKIGEAQASKITLSDFSIVKVQK